MEFLVKQGYEVDDFMTTYRKDQERLYYMLSRYKKWVLSQIWKDCKEGQTLDKKVLTQKWGEAKLEAKIEPTFDEYLKDSSCRLADKICNADEDEQLIKKVQTLLSQIKAPIPALDLLFLPQYEKIFRFDGNEAPPFVVIASKVQTVGVEQKTHYLGHAYFRLDEDGKQGVVQATRQSLPLEPEVLLKTRPGPAFPPYPEGNPPVPGPDSGIVPIGFRHDPMAQRPPSNRPAHASKPGLRRSFGCLFGPPNHIEPGSPGPFFRGLGTGMGCFALACLRRIFRRAQRSVRPNLRRLFQGLPGPSHP